MLFINLGQTLVLCSFMTIFSCIMALLNLPCRPRFHGLFVILLIHVMMSPVFPLK